MHFTDLKVLWITKNDFSMYVRGNRRWVPLFPKIMREKSSYKRRIWWVRTPAEPPTRVGFYFAVPTFQVTIHEFGAAWNRRNSKKALSVCALFCVRGHSEVCILN